MEIKQMLQLDTKQYKKALRDIENYTRKETKKLRTLLESLSIDIDNKRLKKDLSSAKRDINKFKKDAGNIKVKIDADSRNATMGMSSIIKNVGQFGNAIAGIKHGADIIGNLTSSYFEFEESLANTQKTLQMTAEETGMYGDQLTDLSGEVGVTAVEMTGAWTGVMQSGVEAGDALDILEVSSVAAATGMGETAEVSTALTEALLASGAGFDEAGRYADVFSAALGSSKLTLPELSGAMNQLMPAAKKAGVSIESVSASLVSMSKQGKTAPQAMGELGAVMKERYKRPKLTNMQHLLNSHMRSC